jgi:hypothetical protein
MNFVWSLCVVLEYSFLCAVYVSCIYVKLKLQNVEFTSCTCEKNSHVETVENYSKLKLTLKTVLTNAGCWEII